MPEIVALHGFLGQPSDWDGFADLPIQSKPNWLPVFYGLSGLSDLAIRLNRESTGGVLMGYSMGGRIALHMALADSQWNKVVIVSASPGMTSEPEKEARIAADQTWAERFRTDTWTSVISDWNSQPVFASVQQDRLRREEAEYHRDHLAWALEQGSVGRQENLRRRLRAFEGQILWMAGERDRRYAALAEECASLHSGFQSCIIPDAGHRVPWESPVHFSREVLRFLAG